MSRNLNKSTRGWGSIGLLLATLFLILVFAISGGLKLANPARFLLDVQAFEVFPFPIAFVSSLLVPWLEVLCAIALIFRSLAAGAALILTALTTSFIALIGYAWASGLHLDCGCFGEWLVFPNFASHIGFNLLLLLLLVYILVARWPRRDRI